jgi:hypothetical protein
MIKAAVASDRVGGQSQMVKQFRQHRKDKDALWMSRS